MMPVVPEAHGSRPLHKASIDKLLGNQSALPDDLDGELAIPRLHQ
jgi:hypothetical protein